MRPAGSGPSAERGAGGVSPPSARTTQSRTATPGGDDAAATAATSSASAMPSPAALRPVRRRGARRAE